jgi:hypothetical protein
MCRCETQGHNVTNVIIDYICNILFNGRIFILIFLVPTLQRWNADWALQRPVQIQPTIIGVRVKLICYNNAHQKHAFSWHISMTMTLLSLTISYLRIVLLTFRYALPTLQNKLDNVLP